MSSTLDAKIVKNNGINLKFTVKDSTDAIVPITGFSIKWVLRKELDATILITKTVGNGITITNGAAGIFKVKLNPADTVNLVAGKYVHEAIITDSAGDPVTGTDSSGNFGLLTLRQQFAIQ